MNNYISTFTSLSSDTLFLIILIAVFLFIGLRKGKGVLVTIIVSLYISTFLYSYTFLVKSLVFVSDDPFKLFWNHLAIYVLFFVPVYIILNKIISTEGDRGPVGFVKVGLLSVVLVGFTIAILYHFLSLSSVYNFSSSINDLFASKNSLRVWMILPLLSLFF